MTTGSTTRLARLAVMFLLPLAAGFGCGKSDETPEYDLSLQWVQGQSAKYRTLQTTTTNMSVGDLETRSENVEEYTQTCTSVDKVGNATFELTYDRIIIKRWNAGKLTVNYDSSTDKLDDLEPMDRAQALRKGLTFTWTVSPAGNLISSEGDEAYKKAVAEHAGQEEAGLLDSATTQAAMEAADKHGYHVQPADPVKVGDTWESSVNMPLGDLASMGSKYTYLFKEVATLRGRKCAHLVITAEMDMAPADTGKATMRFEEFELSGDIWIDLETRETVLSELTTRTKVVFDKPVSMTSTGESRHRLEIIEP